MNRVVGDAEIKQAFSAVGGRLRERLRAELVALGLEAQQVARGLAPVRTGALRQSIGVVLSETDRKLTLRVAPQGKRNFIGRLIEYGVVAHGTANNRLTAGGSRRARALAVSSRRAAGLYRISPRPFMAPADALLRAKLDGAMALAVDRAAQEF